MMDDSVRPPRVRPDELADGEPDVLGDPPKQGRGRGNVTGGMERNRQADTDEEAAAQRPKTYSLV